MFGRLNGAKVFAMNLFIIIYVVNEAFKIFVQSYFFTTISQSLRHNRRCILDTSFELKYAHLNQMQMLPSYIFTAIDFFKSAEYYMTI